MIEPLLFLFPRCSTCICIVFTFPLPLLRDLLFLLTKSPPSKGISPRRGIVEPPRHAPFSRVCGDQDEPNEQHRARRHTRIAGVEGLGEDHKSKTWTRYASSQSRPPSCNHRMEHPQPTGRPIRHTLHQLPSHLAPSQPPTRGIRHLPSRPHIREELQNLLHHRGQEPQANMDDELAMGPRTRNNPIRILSSPAQYSAHKQSQPTTTGQPEDNPDLPRTQHNHRRGRTSDNQPTRHTSIPSHPQAPPPADRPNTRKAKESTRKPICIMHPPVVRYYKSHIGH